MLLVAQHGVEDGEELAHAGGESDFLQFASLQHLLVLSLDHRVVACGNEGRHMENTADLPTSAFGLHALPACSLRGSLVSCHCHSSWEPHPPERQFSCGPFCLVPATLPAASRWSPSPRLGHC